MVSDVDWEKSTLRVERGIVCQNVDDVKTDGSCKELQIDGDMLDVLKAWYQETQFAGL